MKLWGGDFTYEHCMWRIPCEFKWDPRFLKDAYLILSETSEVRLRYLTLITPGIRHPRHVVETTVEHGIPFALGVKTIDREKYGPRNGGFSRRLMKARIEMPVHQLTEEVSNVVLVGRWLANLGVTFEKPNTQAVIPRGGGAQWIARAFNYMGLVQAWMQGPSLQVSVYHGGANDSADDDCINVHWDDLSEADYQNIFGYVAGVTRDRDAWMFPADKVMGDLLKSYYGEWNQVRDDIYRRVKEEWCGSPCRGRLQTRKDWKVYFHSPNHGRLVPDRIVNAHFIEEGHARLNRAFGGTWNKTRLCQLDVPEQFRAEC
ncbi:hypothetical protein C8R44DRAFT_875752 [Mycena epipterygia]|nr:hypothetical protein C8R44DRAFT_875752 [Mycena epipterygia]